MGCPRLVKESLEKELGFESPTRRPEPEPGGATCPRGRSPLAISALDREPERPFFLWVHFFDPHAPYSPPGPHPFGESRADLYDAELLYADREAGRILDALAARDLLRKTAIVVFSDHGEDLVEFDPGTALTEDQIHVPFGIVLPGRASARSGARGRSHGPRSNRARARRRVESGAACTGSRSFRACSSIPRRPEPFHPTWRFASSEAPVFRSPGSSRPARGA